MQLWKLDKKKLKNKAGFWISTDNWSLLKPEEAIEILELDQINEILEHDQTKVNITNKSNQTYLEKSDDDNVGSGTSVVEKIIETKYGEKWKTNTSLVSTSPQVEQDPQEWEIEKKANEKHFFKLKHPESGKYLTATSSGGLTIEGNKKEII
jgi:hypothetical protein